MIDDVLNDLFNAVYSESQDRRELGEFENTGYQNQWIIETIKERLFIHYGGHIETDVIIERFPILKLKP